MLVRDKDTGARNECGAYLAVRWANAGAPSTSDRSVVSSFTQPAIKEENMKRGNFSSFGIAIVAMIIFATASTSAQGVRGTTSQIRGLLTSIETKTDTFRRAMDNAIDRTRLDNTPREDRIMDLIGDFETATDALRTRFDSRLTVDNEAAEVLNRASLINQFMSRNALNRNVQNQWTSIRTDLNTLAVYYRVSWRWNRPGTPSPGYPPYTVSDNQVRNLLTRIENKTDVYKRRMDRALDRTDSNNENTISMYLTEFENSTDRLKSRFDSRQSVSSDASDVLTRALFIDRYMRNNRLNAAAQSQWRTLRTDLNTLANYYRVSWNWNQPLPPFPTYPGGYPGGYPNGTEAVITGTYRLNTGLSDNVASVIDRSLGNYNTNQRTNVRGNLERRLQSPQMIAIEQVNNTITMASTNSPQVTFQADGVPRTETNTRGRTITTTATVNNNGLTISYEGDRINDYYVTFVPSGSDRMRVSRRIYLENRNETVTVTSVYDRINRVAQWSTVNSRPNWNGGTGNLTDFYVLNGTRMTATLRNAVSTRGSQVGERFAMEVTSPGQYRGAVIEGRVASSERSGRFSGRANVSLEFDTIRLLDGRSFRFAGIIDSVNAANGDNISVNNEGTIRDSSQTTQTVTRAGIGAILGAIIGAIAGGGEGAAIGAGVGAGAGVGSVLITGRDNIELGVGSTFNITATSPNTIGLNR
jgi:hypothetical protein